MLYLFGTGAYDSPRKALKVGYTDDRKDVERRKAYLIHNPLGKFLAERDGDKILELKLHLRLSDYKADFLDEWFYDEEPVVNIFGEPVSKINEWLWANRTEIFPEIPRPGSLKRKIYDELYGIYGGNIRFGEKSL